MENSNRMSITLIVIAFLKKVTELWSNDCNVKSHAFCFMTSLSPLMARHSVSCTPMI